ncbi:hypothetical protein GDO81_026121 [Engystomops pustulosus]|uniref:Uncharacterized protein n=1 Tax=Engystomops pustulosus TaxID=76066 RepID=A0AAV6YIP5_ENGPU|nr:hypothetical protein GDO81_026121 [Engystomops pustulosus]
MIQNLNSIDSGEASRASHKINKYSVPGTSRGRPPRQSREGPRTPVLVVSSHQMSTNQEEEMCQSCQRAPCVLLPGAPPPPRPPSRCRGTG